MKNFKYFIVGFSHSILSLTLFILYFEFKPENFIRLHDIFAFLSILSLTFISLNLVMSVMKIADKLDLNDNDYD